MNNMCTVFAFLFFALSSCFVAYSGEWNWKSDNIKNLFNTPLGSVYEFSLSPDCIYYLGHSERNDIEKCQCAVCDMLTDTINAGIEINLEKNKMAKKKDNKRFLIVEFKIRAFPALSNKSSDFSFEVIFSKNKIIGNPIHWIDSIIRIRSDSWKFDYASRADGFARWPNDTTKKWWYNWNFHSDFDPYSIRIIYDQATGNVGLDINGYFLMREWANKSNKKSNSFSKIKNVAIITAHQPDEENLRTDMLEISPPKVYYCNSENELLNLEKNLFSPYPYGRYSIAAKKQITTAEDIFNRARKEKNPDLQYAYAIRFLYSQNTMFDPASALTLLRKAADKNHVWALYELGVCYYRGYGTKPDYDKAEKFLRKAESFDCEKAAALLLYMHWDTRNRPTFLSHDFYNRIHRFYKKYYTLYHLFEHDLEFVYSLFIGDNVLTPMLSAKYLLFPSTLTFESKFQRNPPQYFRSKSKIHSLLYDLRQGKRIKISPQMLDQIAEETVGTDIFPMFLYYLHRKNELAEYTNIFTPQKDFLYSDNALYLFIKFCHDNKLQIRLPSSPNDIIRMNTKDFPETSRAYLSALTYLSVLSFPSRTTEEGRNNAGKEFFLRIKKCASENRDAAYLLGKFYFYNDLPEELKDKFSKSNQFLASKYLSSAAAKGHLKAKLLLAELELQSASVSSVPNKQFDFLEQINRGLYYRYLGHVLRKKRLSEQAQTMYLKAVQYGDTVSYQFLALSEKNPSKREKYWQEWIKNDRLNRKKDMLDPFSDSIYEEYDKWAKSPYSVSVEQQQERFRKRRMEKSSNKVRVLSNTAQNKSVESKVSNTKRKSKIKFRESAE